MVIIVDCGVIHVGQDSRSVHESLCAAFLGERLDF